MEVIPGTKLLIYIIGIFTILAINVLPLQIIISIIFLILNIYKGNMKRVKHLFLFTTPFLITAAILGFFKQGNGWLFSIILMIKLITIVFWNVINFVNFREQDLVSGLYQLHSPYYLTTTIFFIFRYGQVLKEEIKKLVLARKLRGGRLGQNWFSLQEYAILGQVIGATLIHSLDRGERVYKAMQLRGLKAKTLIKANKTIAANWQPIIITLLISGMVILLDRGWMYIW